MKTIQIRKMTGKQRSILNDYKERKGIKTDSGAIVALIDDYEEFREECSQLYDRLRQQNERLDHLIYHSQAVVSANKRLSENHKLLDNLLNGKRGGKNG